MDSGQLFYRIKRLFKHIGWYKNNGPDKEADFYPFEQLNLNSTDPIYYS